MNGKVSYYKMTMNDKVTDDTFWVFDLQGVYKSNPKVHFGLGKEEKSNFEMKCAGL